MSPEEKTRRERSHQHSSGIVSYAASGGGSVVVFSLSGQLWVVRADTREAERLPACEPVIDPRPEPGGARIGYVSEGALRAIEADGSADRAVAVPDGPDVTFGLPEHVPGRRNRQRGRQLVDRRIPARPRRPC